MRKKIIIIAAIVIILAAAWIGWVLWQNGANSGTPGGSGSLPSVGTSTASGGSGAASSSPSSSVAMETPTSTALVIGTSQGSVSMNNFYKSADYITQDQQTVVIHGTDQYSIQYNAGDSSFSIGILSAPLEAARQAAEAELLSALGISKQDACKLTVYEGVPAYVSSQYVGRNFPLSFCGNATPL